MTCKHNVPEPIYCDAVGECHTHTGTHSKWEPIEPQPIVPRYTVEEIEAYLHYHHVSHERPATMINNPIKGIAAVTKRNREEQVKTVGDRLNEQLEALGQPTPVKVRAVWEILQALDTLGQAGDVVLQRISDEVERGDIDGARRQLAFVDKLVAIYREGKA